MSRYSDSRYMDLRSAGALQRWAAALIVPPEALRAAVLAVGTRVDDVKDFLCAGSAATQQVG